MTIIMHPEHGLGFEDMPMHLFNPHNEAFHYWLASGIKDATLIHIDGHPDTQDYEPWGLLPITEKFKDCASMRIDQFIVPALYHGIVSSLYWLNPHSGILTDFGSTKHSENRGLIKAKIGNGMYTPGIFLNLDSDPVERTVEDIVYEDKVILDIDLDAFCCKRAVWGLPNEYDGVNGFEKRVAETVEFLKKIRKPDLVTIAESIGSIIELNPFRTDYVPKRKLKEVIELVHLGIAETYYDVWNTAA